MIRFLPVPVEKITSYSYTKATSFGYIGYDMSDNNKKCGECVFTLNGYSVDIDYVSVENADEEIAEGLIRSALNYGANRNAYIANYCAKDFLSVASLLGFSEKNGVLTGEIPDLLAGSCCK